MNCNLKLLVMLGASALAFAATAPPASAWEFHKQEGGAKTRYLPDGNSKILTTVAFGTLECRETGEGASEGTVLTEEVMTLTSEECNVGPIQVKVIANGCDYHYVSGLVDFVGTMSMTCPAGKKFELQATGCTITIGEQKGLSSVTFKNIANGGREAEREVTLELKIANLKYEEDNVAPGNTCKKPGVMQENGAFNGPEILTDESANKEMRGFWVA